jgi:hypothetical protein
MDASAVEREVSRLVEETMRINARLLRPDLSDQERTSVVQALVCLMKMMELLQRMSHDAIVEQRLVHARSTIREAMRSARSTGFFHNLQIELAFNDDGVQTLNRYHKSPDPLAILAAGVLALPIAMVAPALLPALIATESLELLLIGGAALAAASSNERAVVPREIQEADDE